MTKADYIFVNLKNVYKRDIEELLFYLEDQIKFEKHKPFKIKVTDKLVKIYDFYSLLDFLEICVYLEFNSWDWLDYYDDKKEEYGN